MRKLLLLSLPALLAATLLHPAQAQDVKGSAKAPAGKANAKGTAKGAPKGKGDAKAKAGGTEKVSGFVKGNPTGKTFVVARRGGTVNVDASGAKIRANGKFAGFDVIKGGTQVNVTGTMSGGTLKATDVDAHPRAASRGGDKKGADAKGGAAKGGAAKGAKAAPAKK